MSAAKAKWTHAQRLAWGHSVRGQPRRQRFGWKFSPSLLRLREIEKLIKHRFKGPVPDPEGTDDRETALDFVRAAAFSVTGQDMVPWCRVYAPWATEADLVPIIAEASKRRRMMRADGVAGLLHVTMAERLALKLKTIGAADMTKAQRVKFMKARKKDADRKRREQERRAAGMKDRKSHAATDLKTIRPWEAEGISRATWFRRQRETRQSRIDIKGKGDTRVSQAKSPSSQPLRSDPAARAARGGGSPETQFLARLPRGAQPRGRRFIQMSPPPHLRHLLKRKAS